MSEKIYDNIINFILICGIFILCLLLWTAILDIDERMAPDQNKKCEVVESKEFWLPGGEVAIVETTICGADIKL